MRSTAPHLARPVRSILSVVAFLVSASALLPAGAHSQAPPASNGASEFTILIYESAEVVARRNDPRAADAYWSSYDQFAAELMKAGVLRGGSALDERVSGTVRGPGSAGRAARLSGYFVIAASDLAAAQQWARKAPAEAASVEVRPHRANPHMSPPTAKRP